MTTSPLMHFAVLDLLSHSCPVPPKAPSTYFSGDDGSDGTTSHHIHGMGTRTSQTCVWVRLHCPPTDAGKPGEEHAAAREGGTGDLVKSTPLKLNGSRARLPYAARRLSESPACRPGALGKAARSHAEALSGSGVDGRPRRPRSRRDHRKQWLTRTKAIWTPLVVSKGEAQLSR